MPTQTVKHSADRPQQENCQNAYLILCSAHDSARAFLDVFTATRRDRRAMGAPTDEEQDLLRAMLLFATAGLDSMVKQLVEDALPRLIDCDSAVCQEFRSFIERRLQRGEKLDHALLADVLSDQDPRRRLVKELVDELTAGSMQSTNQLLRAASFFKIHSKDVCADVGALAKIFAQRNQIAHEMDVDFGHPNRNRRSRTKAAMIASTNTIFEVSAAFLGAVDSRLVASRQASA